jgi:hypothetical protein
MEEITNILPLRKRREWKAMIQAIKYQCSQDHPMITRLKQLSSGRGMRSSFALETRAIQRKHQEVLPKNAKPIVFTLNDPPVRINLEMSPSRTQFQISLPKPNRLSLLNIHWQ